MPSQALYTGRCQAFLRFLNVKFLTRFRFSPLSDFRKNRDDPVPRHFDRTRCDAVVGFPLALLLFELLGLENDPLFLTDFFSAVATPCSKRLASRRCGRRHRVGRQKVGYPVKNFVQIGPTVSELRDFEIW